MNILRYIAISFISGFTAIIPGVSGGTIFAIFGISEQLSNDINQLSNTLAKKFPKHILKSYNKIFTYSKLPFIIGVGSLISSLIYAKFIIFIGEPFEIFLRFLFLGLVIFSLPTLWSETKQIKNTSTSPTNTRYIYAVLGFVFALVLFKQNDSLVNIGKIDYNSFSYLLNFFIVSFIAGITGILPGISGTNIFILGGLFDDYLLFTSNIANYQLQYVIFILATILGSIVAAKCTTWLFKHYRVKFFGLMTGLTASTILMIWSNPFTSSVNIIQMFCGLMLSYSLIKSLNKNA